MAFEPINIFSRKIDPRGVISVLRQLASEVEVAGPEDDWKKVVALGPKRFLRRPIQLSLGHDSSYYDTPGWTKQVFGMRNYFTSFPDVSRKSEILRVIDEFRFVLSVPEDDLNADADDPRMDWIYAICRHLDGVIFTPSSLRDASGRKLISANGDSDPLAKLPHLLTKTSDSINENDVDEEEEEVEPPTAERVAKRAFVLAAVANRGLMEHEAEDREAAEVVRSEMLAWLEGLDVTSELEPEEWKALQRPIGTLDTQSAINSAWRIEGLGILAWSLKWFDLPGYDELVSASDLFTAVRLLDKEGASQLLAESTLRMAAELNAKQKELLALHWRLRDFSLRPQPMDFVAFSKNCWFGSFDLTPFRLIGLDLAIGDTAIANACAEDISRTSSLAHERHLAINWLHGYSRHYSETDTST